MASIPASPPKRMTRARAKVIDEQKPRKTRIVTASAKTNTPKPSKQEPHVEATGQEDQHTNNDVVGEQCEPGPVRATRGRPKKTTAENKSGPDSKGPSAEAKTDTDAPRKRGRPRKAVGGTAAKGMDQQNAKQPMKKPTRATAGTTSSTAKTATTTSTTVSKKKVTFRENPAEDKENVIAVGDARKAGRDASDTKPGDRLTGLKAAPARRAATKGSTTRARKAADGAKQDGPKPLPLSPKKDNQVAKGDALREEPSNDKTHTKLSSKSPVKLATSITQKSPVKSVLNPSETSPERLCVHQDSADSGDELSNSTQKSGFPSKVLSAVNLASPAKRPPRSPFKNSMLTSPMRNFEVPSGASAGSLTFASAHGAPGLPMSSPKKFKASTSGQHPVFKVPELPFKASLMQTPARRGTASPLKTSISASAQPAKSTPFISRSPMKPASALSKGKPSFATPSKFHTSVPLRAETSPERFSKVHTTTSAEQLEILRKVMDEEKVPFPALEDIEDVVEETSMACEEDGASSNAKGPAQIPASSLTLSSSIWPAELGVITDYDAEAGLHQDDMFDNLETPDEPSPAATPPQHPADFLNKAAFQLRTPAMLDRSGEEDSEDELGGSDRRYRLTPLARNRISHRDFARATAGTPASVQPSTAQAADSSVDDLANMFGNMRGATPDPKTLMQRAQDRRILFSSAKARAPFCPTENMAADMPTAYLGLINSQFDEAMAATQQPDEALTSYNDPDKEHLLFSASHISEAFQEYGNENEPPREEMPIDSTLSTSSSPASHLRNEDPIDPAVLMRPSAPPPPVPTCTPARIFAPQHRIVLTISKVPLKPPSESSPVRKMHKRSYTLANPLSPRQEFQLEESRQAFIHNEQLGSSTMEHRASRFSDMFGSDFSTPTKTGSLRADIPPPAVPQTPQVDDAWSVAGTPARTPRPDLDTKLLQGAVVYVDVHTNEGADASGIFVELLTQMGARCVKQWNWNPNAGAATGENEESDPLPSSSNDKIGITHVVFKDGGKRTMEKIREAKGLVHCLGVGWVLDCERENRWLPESAYAIDTCLVPRGGRRRRKSMEPRRLSNVDGSLVSAFDNARIPSKGFEKAALSPTEEFLNFSSPVNRRDSFAVPSRVENDRRVSFAPDNNAPDSRSPTVAESISTTDPPITPPQPHEPLGSYLASLDTPLPSAPHSPSQLQSTLETPYFLHPSNLIQQTCPPRQQQEGGVLFFPVSKPSSTSSLFPVSGRLDDQPDEAVRRRLVLARRKSLQWVPKVGSPLARHGFES